MPPDSTAHPDAALQDSHSLRYYYTGVIGPGSGLPEFSIVGYVDDQQIDSYCSDTGRAVPVARWMEKSAGPEHWEKETQIDKGDEVLFRHEVKLWKKRFNHTGGLHFTQVITGCELRDDGRTIINEQYRIDGEELMFYDTQTGTYIPTMAKAQTVTQRWNKPDIGRGERTKVFLKTICTEKLKRFIEYGREDLERRVQPGVKVTGRESGEVTKLHCVVYGFHPRAVDVKWMKNGTDDVHTYETTGVLPNPDGTYQIRVSAEVIPKEGDSYSCYVDHRSLGEPLLVRWEVKRDVRRVVMVVVAGIVLVLTFGIAVLRTYRSEHQN